MRLFQKSKIQGLTLTEVILTVVIIIIVGAFAVPQFERAIERQIYRKSNLNLIAIHSAMQIHYAQNKEYPLLDATPDIKANINSTFNLKILDDHFTFNYSISVLKDKYWLILSRNLPVAKKYTMTVDHTPISNTNPRCNPANICPRQ